MRWESINLKTKLVMLLHLKLYLIICFHHWLGRKLRVKHFPSGFLSEADISPFVKETLKIVTLFIMDELKLPDRSIIIQQESNEQLTSEQLHMRVSGRADYIIIAFLQNVNMKLKLIEVKKDFVQHGFKQCIMGSKYVWQSNRTKRTVTHLARPACIGRW